MLKASFKAIFMINNFIKSVNLTIDLFFFMYVFMSKVFKLSQISPVQLSPNEMQNFATLLNFNYFYSGR